MTVRLVAVYTPALISAAKIFLGSKKKKNLTVMNK
jgi:hypothetical protein